MAARRFYKEHLQYPDPIAAASKSTRHRELKRRNLSVATVLFRHTEQSPLDIDEGHGVLTEQSPLDIDEGHGFLTEQSPLDIDEGHGVLTEQSPLDIDGGHGVLIPWISTKVTVYSLHWISTVTMKTTLIAVMKHMIPRLRL